MKKLHITTTLLLSVLTATASFSASTSKDSYSEKVAPTDPSKILQQHQERIDQLEAQRQRSLADLERVFNENTAKKSDAEQFLKLFELAEKTTMSILSSKFMTGNDGKQSAAEAFALSIRTSQTQIKNLSGAEELLASLNEKIEATKTAIIELGGIVPGSEIGVSDSVKVEISSSSVVSPVSGDQLASKPLSKKQQRKLRQQQAKDGSGTPQ